jgi:hypothetical protein
MIYKKNEVPQILKERAEGDAKLRLLDNPDWNEIHAYDFGSFQLMKDLFAQFGPISKTEFGDEASYNAWLLVQHQDNFVDFQLEYLKAMKQNPENYNPREIAYLTDRTLMNTNQPQIYGTQFVFDAKRQKYVPYQTVEPSKVNERRSQAGMESIEEYVGDSDWDLTDFYQ